jgi:ABC-type multidrug transport system fused ATPase/permease subunit
MVLSGFSHTVQSEHARPSGELFPVCFNPHIAQILGTLSPLALGMGVDAIISGQSYSLYMFSWAFAAFASVLLREAQRLSLVRIQMTTFATTAHRVMHHLMVLGVPYQLSTKVTATQRCVQRGLESVNRALDNVILRLLPALLEVLSVLLVITWRFHSIWLALTLLLGVSVYVISSSRLSAMQRTRRKAQNKADSATYAAFTDTLQNMQLVTAYSAEPNEVRRYATGVAQYLDTLWEAKRFTTQVTMVQTVMMRGTQLAGYLLAAQQLHAQTVSVGDFMAMVSFIGSVFAPVSWLPNLVMELSNQVTDVIAMCAVLEVEPNAHSGAGMPALPCMAEGDSSMSAPMGPAVEFRKVSFAYPQGVSAADAGSPVDELSASARLVLDDVSFTVAPGSTTVIVGETGSGKSTLLSLLLRQWELPASERGKVLVGGGDIAQHAVDSLRRGTALVSQAAVMLDTSIRDNILLGKPEATDAEVASAVTAAQLDRTIASLPQGLDTCPGAGGGQLSGGERQRVALARAFLRRPRVLLLDECTSALDANTDAAVMQAVRAIQEQLHCTTLVVAHRLSSASFAQQVVVMGPGGVLLQAGSPGELEAEQGGPYAVLLRAQANPVPAVAQ